MIIESHSVHVIKIPEGRFRAADPKTVEKIAASMVRFGQLQPIIIDRELNLVDGLHRLTAALENGASEISAVFADQMDELFLKEVELEVNIQRKDMTWLEREKAIATLHEIKVKRDPNWSQTHTQQVVGAARQADVSDAIKLMKMVEIFPELAGAKSKHQAMSWAKAKAGSVTRVMEVRDNPVDFAAIEEKIILGDSVEVIKRIPDESFNAVITDPPFGINYDDRKAGTTGTLTDYEDGEESYLRLLSMAPDLYRVIKPDGWLIWFMGISWYEKCKETFRAAGFLVDEIPIIWDRSDGRSFTTRPDRYFGRAYDVALHCIKGDPQVVQRSKPNIIRVPPVTTAERETLSKGQLNYMPSSSDALLSPENASLISSSAQAHAPRQRLVVDGTTLELNETPNAERTPSRKSAPTLPTRVAGQHSWMETLAQKREQRYKLLDELQAVQKEISSLELVALLQGELLR